MRELPTGREPSTAEFNALLARVRRLEQAVSETSLQPRITSTPPLEVRCHPGGVHLALAPVEEDLHVELTASLSGGGSAGAKVLWFDGSAWQDAATEEITVQDVIGTMEGSPGDKALVRWHRQSGMWILWQLQC